MFLNYLKDLGVFSPDLYTVNSNITALTDRVTALEGTVGGHTTSISSLGATNTSLDNRITTLEGKSDIYVGNSAPSDTSRIWVDTSAN